MLSIKSHYVIFDAYQKISFAWLDDIVHRIMNVTGPSPTMTAKYSSLILPLKWVQSKPKLAGIASRTPDMLD